MKKLSKNDIKHLEELSENDIKQELSENDIKQELSDNDSKYLETIHYLKQCLTFLPLRSLPVDLVSRKEIAIGFVDGNHFIEVFFFPNHHVPPIAADWYRCHQPIAKGSKTTYTSRIQYFQETAPNNDGDGEKTIDIATD
ncbi:hypothetical protein Dsin_005981 [Dipteronia sinensis]|uniref:Uncharacterized protein n=1 Tax=Dipteronia sinensis TaxID=43782 RepID=A0AAE0EFF1_9ROSI|nr:hypothetical protein Dsin_005981 [Dipteronia sinensis]